MDEIAAKLIGSLAGLLCLSFVMILFVLAILLPVFVYLINSRVKQILKEQKESNKNMRELLSKIQ